MNEEQAYLKLQEFLALAEELKSSGHYSREDLLYEITSRIGEE